MEDENEYRKLPTDEKCVHKLWKARVAGYEEATKLFNQIDDEKSPEWNKFLGLIKKFVTDSNAMAQEKGLEAALVFIENCKHAGKVTSEVMAGIVTKCIAAPKTKTKDLALQVTLMFVEIEKQEAVQEELMKGMEHKNPKISCACIVATIAALKQFGNKVVSIKPLVKKIPIMLADRDKDVRSEGKNLVVEMHRWIGGAIEPHIASLQPVVQQELREAFTAAGTGARPLRYLRSQQQRQEAVVVEQGGEGDEDENDGEQGGGDSADMNPFDLLDPVEILGRLPKDFYDKLEAKKWQERKEALEALEGLLKTAPKLESGDYGDLLRALKKVVGKDSNVVLVATAGRCMAQVASGLRTKFQPYAVSCMGTILEKFKEKKPAVVTALREAADAIYPSTNLEALMEDMGEAFKNKNPSVKTESALFLARALCRTQPAVLNKKLLKFYVPDLLKLLESADPAVRDASAEALGTAMKLVTEKNIAPHMGKLEPLKEQKIKEFCDKAVIQVKKKAPAAKGDGPGPATAGSKQAKPVKRPITGAKKLGLVKKVGAGAKAETKALPAREQELSQQEVDERAEEVFGTELITDLSNAKWKTRLSAVQNFSSQMQGLSQEAVSAQVLLRTINKKQGLRDSSVQVLKARLEVVKSIVENFSVSVTSAEFVLEEVTEKLGDAKCSELAAEVLTSLAEATKLENIALIALEYATEKQKNPKVQAETYTWLAAAIKQFGFTMNVKLLVPYLKKGVTATNPTVRMSCIGLVGFLSIYTGPNLMTHFESEKPALKQQIQAEMDKYVNDEAPTPIRGVSKSASKASIGGSVDLESEVGEEDDGEEEPTAAPIREVAPRTDITTLITDALINEINDKDWKVRNEGLEKLKDIIATSAPIKASLGELPPALAARLLDSNSKIALSTLQILGQLATAMGPKCKIYVRTFFPGLLQALGDNKAWVRSASVACIGAWCAAAGGAGVVLEGEMVLDALKGGSPALRAELLQWLSENLPTVPVKSIPKEELVLCLPILYACLEDRSADVRKNSAEAIYGFMLHLTYDTMHKQVEKVKPGSKAVVIAALEKVRPNMPIQPMTSAKGQKEDKTVKSGGAQKKEGDKKVIPARKAKVRPVSAKTKKDEDESCTPLLPINNTKNQRIIDDQKLKVLKWNFVVPREEFFDLLKEQMSHAGLNKQLISNMFHADFRYHLKAIESLSEDLSENGHSLMCNLDLVLKWLTLRFFDTNPSVLLKGLEYLNSMFTVLIKEYYTLAEYEANCFIPYLVMKVGDPKDTVRNGVKALFKQICVVYSVTKLFGYLMEGLKSKNARQRTECLECIGHLLECYGSSVCSPNTPSALKELARHIGDRDNSVRSAALNCITNAYFLEGEKIYKMIGQMTDKDLSLLEERIKRAAKMRTSENRKSSLIPLTATGQQMMQQPSKLCIEEEEKSQSNQISVDQNPASYDEPEDEPEPVIAAPRLIAPQPSVLDGPYRLDPELLARLDAEKPTYKEVVCKEMDLAFMDEIVSIPSIRPPKPVNNIISSILQMSPPSRITASSLQQNSGPGSYLSSTQVSSAESTMLTDTIHSIASPNLKVAMSAISLINELITSGRGAALIPHEDALILAVATQIRRLRSVSTPDHDTCATYKYLMAMLTLLYDNAGTGKSVTSSSLGFLLSELLLVLVTRSLEAATEAERFVRAANTVCVRVLYSSDHTALLMALMTLLHESIGEESIYPRYQELLMKCVWKALKMMSSWDVDSIDYDILMQKVHHFYKTYPNAYWKKNTNLNDTPNRTVKTLVHTLVKLKGASIMNHLTLIPNVQESELYAYLIKLFKNIKLDDTKKENVSTSVSSHQTPTHTDLPRPVHEELQRILTRIGDKEHCQEALVQLYDLRERHPNVDIWVYLKGSSMIFRNFIERGLREVAEERRAGRNYAPNFAPKHNTSDSNNYDDEPEGDEKKHTYYLDRLRTLQAAAGMRVDSTTASDQRSPVIDNKTLVDTIGDQPRHNIDPQFDLHTIQSLSQRNTEADVDVLRQKLQQIKSSLNR